MFCQTEYMWTKGVWAPPRCRKVVDPSVKETLFYVFWYSHLNFGGKNVWIFHFYLGLNFTNLRCKGELNQRNISIVLDYRIWNLSQFVSAKKIKIKRLKWHHLKWHWFIRLKTSRAFLCFHITRWEELNLNKHLVR